jgi:hypothetical protein
VTLLVTSSLSLPEETRRRPVVAIKTLADYFSGSQRLPFPVKLGFSVEIRNPSARHVFEIT